MLVELGSLQQLFALSNEGIHCLIPCDGSFTYPSVVKNNLIVVLCAAMPLPISSGCPHAYSTIIYITIRDEYSTIF
jgi:hypothetical protein